MGKENTDLVKSGEKHGFESYAGVLPSGEEVDSSDAVKKRRKVVMEYRANGYTHKAIAKELKISESLVRKDINKFKENLKEQIQTVDRDEVAGEVLFWWDLVLSKTMDTLSECVNVGEKNQTIKTMIKAIKGRTDFMFDSGILEKQYKGDKGGNNFIVKGVDVKGLNVQALINMADDIKKEVEEKKKNLIQK